MGCAGSDPRKDAIDLYLIGLADIPTNEPNVSEGAPSNPERVDEYQCTSQPISRTRQYDHVVAYAANSESMWPGSIIRGDSIYSGQFTPIGFDRAPLTFSVSLENLAGAKSATMASPSLSSYRDALSTVLDAEITGSTPANIFAEIEEVHSDEQLTLALGASASWLGSVASISSNFHFADQKVKSRYVVRYTQGYYTVDVDSPSRPSDFFSDNVTVEDVEARANDNNPPVYVSSVTYGRMVVFTFESEYSAREMGAALDFVYTGGADVSGDVSLTYREMVSNSNITAYILGGSAEQAARSIDNYEALMDFIRDGGDYSRESPGAPIAYKLSYLKDSSPARYSFTEDYEVVDCERVSQRVLVTLDSITVDDNGGDAGSDLEIFGKIWVGAGVTVPLFDKTENQYVVVRQGETWPQTGIIAEAVVDVAPRDGEGIFLGAQLYDYDSITLNDDIGAADWAAMFETGWRRSVDLLLTGDRARVVVHLTLTPI